MSEAKAKFPKNTDPAKTKSWRSSPAYFKGVAKAQAREQSRLEKALKNGRTTEAERIKANDRLTVLEKEIEANQKRINGAA